MSQKRTPASPDAAVSRRAYTTPELAEISRVLPESIRSALWRHGHYAGIKPIKLGTHRSARLLWPAAEVDALFGPGGA